MMEKDGLKEKYIELNMGPQHPSTHGVLRLKLLLDGETVKKVEPVIGYLHRNAEKICELDFYCDALIYFDRMDYVAAMNMEVGYLEAAEKLLNIEPPERVVWIRTVMAELNRIASHLVWAGAFGLDLGMLTPFFYVFEQREKVLDLFTEICGSRQETNYMSIGGVYQDFNDKIIYKIKEFTKQFPKKLDEVYNLFAKNDIFISRTKNVGILEPEVALDYGVTGPMLRASGIPYDVRKAEPYLAYDKVNFDIPISKRKDVLARFVVRFEEMRQSVRIINQALDKIPDGPYFNPKAKKSLMVRLRGEGDVYARTESTKGEFGVYLVGDGSVKPYRVHVRSPSFKNLSVLPYLAKDVLIADMVAISGSIDLVFGEVDR
ncbi:NADH-quinone oxidoreductase subunit D [Cuniculiplasma divulgatum]|jgi:NADH-quinone oxidoreductase subunit D|uniref:NADH dehydrogenase subunit D n=1 Tax=Cuniculiplasma divulgatum TaxID=1673428 RepID=A0A1N5WAK0_9ARCH|nr:NADH-quinone oxidoreductase subunit D [Cuniculiplasma divulgatum]MCI2413273.1 NADH-quinone oxidoreductase subunit D [Cuniculiplasma sp.]MCL4319871.1 NADH-quinone oxidoreductase subunit D [Candidatus Thermoplasmatota archaeon]OWP55488.1 MAG: NADH dehydrogenase subunit D [Cuniculiplasma sp. C_DKE]WMT49846.1 MAG: NADH-quinone oxidoreductase subunit D [Thermoplasmatales archaeon]SIM82184.1 NADH dehydrogenase subunit D [Cuniculiplasma divulgatum]